MEHIRTHFNINKRRQAACQGWQPLLCILYRKLMKIINEIMRIGLPFQKIETSVNFRFFIMEIQNKVWQWWHRHSLFGVPPLPKIADPIGYFNDNSPHFLLFLTTLTSEQIFLGWALKWRLGTSILSCEKYTPTGLPDWIDCGTTKKWRGGGSNTT